MKRRDFIKGLVAAPVVAKVVAEAGDEYEWVEPKDVVKRLKEGYTIVNPRLDLDEYALQERRRAYREGTNQRGLRVNNNCSWGEFTERYEIS